MSGFKCSSGERSNIYSESKFTNWSRYNPFDLEISTLPKYSKPKLRFETGSGAISVYVQKLHPKFIHPVCAEDIQNVLNRVPAKFLVHLHAIYLLGGTSRQLKASKKSFRYGCYESGTIYLYAFPEWMLRNCWGNLPKPTVVEEYKRMGADWRKDEAGWWLEFDQGSLERFYLFDVLLHELGHHVDKRVWERDTPSAERYAEWFALETARAIREPSTHYFTEALP
ncbi:hypothetical protein C1752_06618 [Acaryochloris thomasi RCC1774]|uniref:Uncharacterized protein n=1 Tax=Acaryochloris thomasi RCC1774 TaxID=1764569 RepID=A0A2W1JBA7_9CYAN|nr:hypothetical protein [Acaryochloris thomasi]PZD71339.1 hypothetical protein C1752_06618 [Acaryochloris thomasi RCC1774]